MILFGHPSGGPFSHHAALAHFEAGRLEAFCVPWMPRPVELASLRLLPAFSSSSARIERRSFQPLLSAPLIEDRFGEWRRLLRRATTAGEDERLAYEANDWLMRTMRRECQRASVDVVHAYEDCSLWQFEEAKRLGKVCLYDMPIGFYPAWQATQDQLIRNFAEWIPPGGLPSSKFVRPAQKKREMELADLVLAPGTFVKRTIHQFYPDKRVEIAPYGVDTGFWHPPAEPRGDVRPLRFIYAGQCSLRKGIPTLIKAWRQAALPDAELELVGSWQLSPQKSRDLPSGVTWTGALSRPALRDRYHQADVFVFPSFFEGFGLVLLEAMACGLAAMATDATAAPDVLDEASGRIVGAGNQEELVATLQWFSSNRDRVAAMGRAARLRAEASTWENYRRAVNAAVAHLQ